MATLNGKEIQVACSPADTVDALGDHVSEVMESPPGEMQLYNGEHRLQPGTLLRENGVQDGTQLTALLSPGEPMRVFVKSLNSFGGPVAIDGVMPWDSVGKFHQMCIDNGVGSGCCLLPLIDANRRKMEFGDAVRDYAIEDGSTVLNLKTGHGVEVRNHDGAVIGFRHMSRDTFSLISERDHYGHIKALVADDGTVERTFNDLYVIDEHSIPHRRSEAPHDLRERPSYYPRAPPRDSERE